MPPYLHILLGIVKRHHDMLEKECHSIDLQIADVLANRREKVDESTKFGSFVISKQNAKQLVKKKARKEHKLATLPHGSEKQQKTKKEIAVIEKNCQSCKNKSFLFDQDLSHQAWTKSYRNIRFGCKLITVVRLLGTIVSSTSATL